MSASHACCTHAALSPRPSPASSAALSAHPPLGHSALLLATRPALLSPELSLLCAAWHSCCNACRWLQPPCMAACCTLLCCRQCTLLASHMLCACLLCAALTLARSAQPSRRVPLSSAPLHSCRGWKGLCPWWWLLIHRPIRQRRPRPASTLLLPLLHVLTRRRPACRSCVKEALIQGLLCKSGNEDRKLFGGSSFTE